MHVTITVMISGFAEKGLGSGFSEIRNQPFMTMQITKLVFYKAMLQKLDSTAWINKVGCMYPVRNQVCKYGLPFGCLSKSSSTEMRWLLRSPRRAGTKRSQPNVNTLKGCLASQSS